MAGRERRRGKGTRKRGDWLLSAMFEGRIFELGKKNGRSYHGTFLNGSLISSSRGGGGSLFPKILVEKSSNFPAA